MGTIKGIRNVKKKTALAVWLEVPDDDDGAQTRKTADRDEWKAHLTNYCQKKYVDDKINDGCIRERVDELRGQAKTLPPPPSLTVDVVVRARAALTSNQCAGGNDPIVAEVLMLVPILVVEQVTQLFRWRYMGKIVEEIEEWRTLLLVLLVKPGESGMRLEHYRGIALVSCFSKWYMGVLVLLYEQQTMRPSLWKNVCSLGFQVGQHVGTLTGAILMIFRSAYEWRMSSTMDQAGAHPHLNAAILEETDNLCAEVRFEDLTVKVPYNKMRQGSQEAPPIFRDLVIAIISPLADSWRQRGLGYNMEFYWLTHMIWADNIFIFAASPQQMQIMSRELTNEIYSIGLQWERSSLETMCTRKMDTPLQLQIPDQVFGGFEFWKVVQKDEVIALGCKINTSGSSEVALEYRCKVAEQQFWASRQVCALPCVQDANVWHRNFGQWCYTVEMALLGMAGWQGNSGDGRTEC